MMYTSAACFKEVLHLFETEHECNYFGQPRTSWEYLFLLICIGYKKMFKKDWLPLEIIFVCLSDFLKTKLPILDSLLSEWLKFIVMLTVYLHLPCMSILTISV